jgi:hypothetical protein
MPATIVKLSATGGAPTVEIIVGHAHFGMFDLNLFDATGRNPQKIGEGVTSDTTPDIFPLPKALTDLNGCTIFWRATVASPTGTPNEQFSIFVRVVQGNSVAGTDTQTGPVDGPSPKGFIRLVVE